MEKGCIQRTPRDRSCYCAFYARHPGRQFATGELETLLGMELPDRVDLNINDFFNQLQRKPLIPVERNAGVSYIPESVKVCFLDHLNGSSDNHSSGPDIPMETSGTSCGIHLYRIGNALS